MREIRLSGSVEGVVSDHDSYSDRSIRRLWPLSFASTLFEIWAVSTIVFAPLLWVEKHLVIDAFKW